MTEKQRVLIIDDAPMMLRTLNSMLEDDYEIIIAKGGEQGIRSAKMYLPDIILLDLMMPGIPGFEVLAELKADETTKDIPVVLVTGSGSKEDEEKGYDLGAVDYIKKPFATKVVQNRVKFNVEYAMMKKEINK